MAVGLWMVDMGMRGTTTSKRRSVTDDEHNTARRHRASRHTASSQESIRHPTVPVLGWAGAAGKLASIDPNTQTSHRQISKSRTASALLQVLHVLCSLPV